MRLPFMKADSEDGGKKKNNQKHKKGEKKTYNKG